MNVSFDLCKKTFLVITGASRGIGKEMAIQLATKLKNNSQVVLLARSGEGLSETKCAVESLGKELIVQTFCIDLGKASSLQFTVLLTEALSAASKKSTDFERAFIIHNAGSVGDVSKRASECSDIEEWIQYYHINLFSTISLNCEFFTIFKSIPKLVVNLSSKCGIEPFSSMSFYCSGKAAREMYFRVLAVEETENTLVLNYAPGAIDTEMTIQVQAQTINTELSNEFKKQRNNKTMLTVSQTTRKFIEILEQGKFKSGDHVDYWD